MQKTAVFGIRVQVSYAIGEDIDEDFLFRGADRSREIGINAALLNVRGLECENKYTSKQITSYFLGAVLIDDILYNLKFSENDTIYIGGKASLQKIYSVLFKHYGKNKVIAVKDGSDLGYKGVLEIIYNTKQ